MGDRKAWDGGGRPPGRARVVRSVLGFGAVLFVAAAVWLQNTPDMFQDLPRSVLWTCSLLGAVGQAIAAVYLGPEALGGPRSGRPVWKEGFGNNLLQPVAHFVGYDAEQERMRSLFTRFPRDGWRGLAAPRLARGAATAHEPPLVIVVTGLPATGKSQLANRVARQVADRFPDGVRWMDLSRNLSSDGADDTAPDANGLRAAPGTGAAPEAGRARWLPRVRRRTEEPEADGLAAGPRLGTSVPRTVTSLLEEALDAAGDTPRGPRRQLEDAWRTITAGRRMLLLLENAEDPAQVEALLPNSALSAVLVTSRRSFQDAAFAFTAVTIDGLTADEGVDLLERLAPVDPAADADQERELRRRIVEHCHGLPLAVSMCGRHLASPSGPDAGRLLEKLRREDETPLLGPRGFPASFTVVYRMCGPAARLLLRRMAATGMDEVADYAAAALLGVDRAAARAVIEELQSLYLLQALGRADDGVYRYRLHELVRDTLRALRPTDFGLTEEEGRAWTEEATRAARARLVRAYAWLVERVAESRRPADVGFPQPPLAADAGLDRVHRDLGLTAPERPHEWLDRESEVVLGCIWMAADDGLVRVAWRLARAVAAICSEVRAHWAEWDQAVEAQLAVALGNRDALALGMGLLDASELSGGRGGYRMGDTYAQRAAYVFAEIDADQRWTARARRSRAVSLQRWGDLDAAQRELTLAERVFAETGERWWHARTLYNLAELHFDLGRHDTARELLERAGAAFTAEGDGTQCDLTRILLAQVLAARGRELHAWYLLEEMRVRFARQERHWYIAQCLRVMGELDGDALERQYRECDLVFNRRRRTELRDQVERDYARELRLRERENRAPQSLKAHMELRQERREELERRAADRLGPYADGAEAAFTRAATGGRARARERRRRWSVAGRTDMLREAIGLMERMGDEWGMRRAQLTLGRVLIRDRNWTDGRALIREAADGFARLRAADSERQGGPGDKRWEARAHHLAAEELFRAAVGPSAAADAAAGVRPAAVAPRSRAQIEAAREHAELARSAYGERANHSGRIATAILLARILSAGGSEPSAVAAHLADAKAAALDQDRADLAGEADEWRRVLVEGRPDFTGWEIR
jgi:tetratricopeptide (TPR) repeat protein